MLTWTQLTILSAQATVVTADGRILTANESENPDLFWALSGGGAGNYAVTTSMTVKVFPDTYVGAGTLAFYVADTTEDAFYEGINAFHAALPAMVDAGSMVVYYFTSTVSYPLMRCKSALSQV